MAKFDSHLYSTSVSPSLPSRCSSIKSASQHPLVSQLLHKSDSVSPRSGRMIVAQQFTAGMRSGRIEVREADGWNGSRQINAVFSRPFHGLHLASLPSQRIAGLFSVVRLSADWVEILFVQSYNDRLCHGKDCVLHGQSSSNSLGGTLA